MKAGRAGSGPAIIGLMSGFADEPVIRIMPSRPSTLTRPKEREFPPVLNDNGATFTEPESGIRYEWVAVNTKPKVDVRVTEADGRFRYQIHVANLREAKDPVRRVMLAWNEMEHRSLPEFRNAVIPIGWEDQYHAFVGLLQPGSDATFTVESELAPSELRLLVLGDDPDKWYRDLSDLAAKGASDAFIHYVIRYTSPLENVGFDLQDLLR
jgi:hypothetical protein